MQPGCMYAGTTVSGHFDFRQYQAVIAVSVLLYLHSLLFTLYYILPVDDKDNKYVPGKGGNKSLTCLYMLNVMSK